MNTLYLIDWQDTVPQKKPVPQDFSAVQIQHMIEHTKAGDIERLQAETAFIASLPETKRKTALALLRKS